MGNLFASELTKENKKEPPDEGGWLKQGDCRFFKYLMLRVLTARMATYRAFLAVRAVQDERQRG